MRTQDQIKEELFVLGIDITAELTKKYVTAKFRKLAKKTHPDKAGGSKCDFQIVDAAYKKIIKFIEESEDQENEEDFETDFFMSNNFMKECTASYVVYIQEKFVDEWQKVLERHLGIYKVDNIKIIFKNGDITVTLYKKPKKDPRPKLHIQSKNQEKNLDFVLESLSKFYHEVCTIKSTVHDSLSYRELERSLCIKCGKYFATKKGLKQHVIRMHTSKKLMKDKTNVDGVGRNPEETFAIAPAEEKTIDIITVETSFEDIRSPIPKKKRGDGNKEINQTEFINSLVGDLLDKCAKEIYSNFQCGDCGNMFVRKDDLMTHVEKDHVPSQENLCEESGGVFNDGEDVNKHLTNHQSQVQANECVNGGNIAEKNTATKSHYKDSHTEDESIKCGECYKTFDNTDNLKSHLDSHSNKIGDCQSCYVSEREERILRDCIEDKDDIIKELHTKIETLIKKNVALDKANKRLSLAFNESIVEKSELKKELTNNIEALNDTIKENVKLNDELIAKTELIKLLNTNNSQEETENESVENDEWTKCKECDYKTKVKKYMKSHVLAHQGQYGCQLGCKEKFKTLRDLDEHHKNKHMEAKVKCNDCKSTFKTAQQLTHHIENKHTFTNFSKCNKCEYVASNEQELKKHIEGYHIGFQQPLKNICKYFLSGRCIKDSACRFAHPQNKTHESSQSTQACRNGANCVYLFEGRCRFVHRGTRAQNPGNNQRYNRNTYQNSRSWCKFLEDCYRVPNCPFKHFEEDFPELPSTNNPPIWMMRSGNMKKY